MATQPEERTKTSESLVLVKDDTNGDRTTYSIALDDSSEPILRQSTFQSTPSIGTAKYLFKSLPSYLLESEIHIIISTKSGTEKAEDVYKGILEPIFGVTGIMPLVRAVERTTSQESVRAYAQDILLKRANEGIRLTVILLSGDGGVVDLINGIMDGERSSSFIKPILSLFPLGTGNALYHSMTHDASNQNTPASSSIASTIASSIHTLLHGTPTSLPTFRAAFSPDARLLTNEARTASAFSNQTLYGAVVASYGFHATLVADSDTAAYRKHGEARFGMVVKNLLDEPHSYKARVIITKSDGAEVVVGDKEGKDEHAYVLATLVSNLQSTFRISPWSKPLDGSLRLVRFGPRSGEDIMGIMTKAYDGGKHVNDTGNDKVTYEEIERIRIDFQEEGEESTWKRVCIDGLIVRVEQGGWVDVRKMKDTEGPLDIVAPVPAR